MGRPELNRRQLLATAGGLAVAGSFGFVALGTGADALAAGADTRVRYWNLFRGGDGANMIAMLDAFRKAHPGIAVKDSTLQWGNPFYTKLAMAAAGNRVPELGVMHMGRVAGFSPGHLLDPWDIDLLAKYGVRESDYSCTGKPMPEGGGDLLLASHGRYIGPGGESVFRAHGQDWLAYHYYDADDNGTPKLGLNRLSWSRDGWPTAL